MFEKFWRIPYVMGNRAYGSKVGKCGMDNLNVSFNKEQMYAIPVMWSSKSAQTWQDEQGKPTIYLP